MVTSVHAFPGGVNPVAAGGFVQFELPPSQVIRIPTPQARGQKHTVLQSVTVTKDDVTGQQIVDALFLLVWDDGKGGAHSYETYRTAFGGRKEPPRSPVWNILYGEKP